MVNSQSMVVNIQVVAIGNRLNLSSLIVIHTRLVIDQKRSSSQRGKHDRFTLEGKLKILR